MDVLERLSGPSKPAGSDGGDEGVNEDNVDAFFVDLFVRCNNHRAVEMYEKLGYSVFRRVVE
jgi:N-terminal acetyltransferase B complex catalytic subunit